MFSPDRSVIRRAAGAACLVMALAGSAFAQEPKPAPQTIEYFSRYNFYMAGMSLSGDDPRFAWDAHFGANVDALDYVVGRMSFLMDYEAVMGSEYRPFDPNQGNYILEASVSGRVSPATEGAAIFHHVSRHLSDRPKTFAVAYNLIEGRYLRKFTFGDGTSVAVRAGGGRLAQHSQVDYTWALDWDVMARRRMNPHVEWYGRSTGEMFGVDPLVRNENRGVQYTTRLELGTRLTGTKADLELFVGAEHRLDASLIDFVPVSWAIAGFRIVSK